MEIILPAERPHDPTKKGDSVIDRCSDSRFHGAMCPVETFRILH